MHALFSLHRDHRLLLDLTDALESFARTIVGAADVGPGSVWAENVCPGDVGAFARAFQEFADNVHYEKEEQVLLPFLARHGFDWNGDLLSRVRDDHSQDRYLIEVLHHAAQRQTGFSRDDRRRLASTAETLAQVQRGLLMMQDIELFPAVSSSLDAHVLEELCAELSEFDLRRAPRAVEYQRLIGSLMMRYGDPGSAPSNVSS